ncbi:MULTISPECIES: acetyltransferase [unclassified Azospirillum]|uniref:acetyltransferase n=1 Tax=unclassified Azospirillum TaxID=2630922 RepID=UPI000B711A62|nr:MULTISPECIES: acetyltransferase [unclassified Azospirillum]SNR96033.1 putative acetyltransferase [Azospirillum sp. RU38E]SNS12749.1 putative acetyltransferase [Azospirillum sp. RU37A]
MPNQAAALLPPIRLSTEADIPEIHRVWRASVHATHGFITAADLDFYEELLRTLYLPSARVWLATQATGQITGFIGLGGPKIECLFVDPAFHRQGVGQRLITHALSLQPNLLVDVNEQNPGAIAFYVAQGFRYVGRTNLDHCGKPYPLVYLARF